MLTIRNPNKHRGGPDRQPAQAADGPIPFEPDDADYNLGFTQPAPSPAESETPLPTRSTRTNAPQSEKPLTPFAASKSRSPNTSPTLHAGEVRAKGERPSVQDELRSIKAMLRQRESVTPRPKTPIRIHRDGQAR